MVDTQVRPSDVTKFPIIDALLNVPREKFVPDGKREAAYIGENLSIGPSRVILEPRTLAKLLDILDIKNNELVQSGRSNDMLWKIDELISYVSQYFTLKIGDLIFTGTPSGVSKVESGDILEGYISSINMFTLKVK